MERRITQPQTAMSETQIVATVAFVSAEGLDDKATFGKQDPYVKGITGEKSLRLLAAVPLHCARTFCFSTKNSLLILDC